jgi:hypothetical protein
MKPRLVTKITDGADREIRMSIVVVDERYDALIEIFRSTESGPKLTQGVRIPSRKLKDVVNFIRQVRNWNPANDR